MKQEYEELEMEIIPFEAEDVIRASGESGDTGETGGEDAVKPVTFEF